jgi:hypothetical protein
MRLADALAAAVVRFGFEPDGDEAIAAALDASLRALLARKRQIDPRRLEAARRAFAQHPEDRARQKAAYEAECRSLAVEPGAESTRRFAFETLKSV